MTHGPSESTYPYLLSPFSKGRLTLRNRLIHASMTTRFGSEQMVTEKLIAYHRNRALGGAAMTITEPLSTIEWQSEPHKVDVHAARNQDGLKRWAVAVEEADCRLIGQLQDSGRGRREEGRHDVSWAPSPLPDDLSWSVPRALSCDQIDRFMEQTAAAVALLEAAGFSGVEISAGHGHLIHQFLSPWSNRRDDEYGGDLDGRTRFLREMIAAVRSGTSTHFLVGLKLPGDDGVAGGIGLAEAGEILERVAVPGEIDFLSFAHGSHGRSLEMHIPDMNSPRLPYVEQASQLRKRAGGIPVLALGLITDPAEAEGILAKDQADLVGLGRSLVTDAEWLSKAAAGRTGNIRYCVSCNNCWGEIVSGKPIRCDNNPRLGEPDELTWRPPSTKSAKRVVIVGGGVAALEAGWIAAARGNDVTLFCSSSEPGGSARLHAELPGCENISSIYDYQLTRAAQAGVKFETGWRANRADVMAMNPEHVIVASGSRMNPPAGVPQELLEQEWVPDLRATCRMLLGNRERVDGTAVLLDADHTSGTYAAAGLLAQIFDRLVIVTPRERIATDTHLVGRQGIYRRLTGRHVQLITLAELAIDERLEEGMVGWRNVITDDRGVVDEVALVTYATARHPVDEIAADLSESEIPVSLIGDSFIPRNVMAAVGDGYRVGLSL